jgi:hypothetical protein
MLFKYQYLATAALLRTVEHVKTVEFYRGQDRPDQRGNVRTQTAVYLTFPDVNLDDLSGGTQEGEMQMDVIVVSSSVYTDDKLVNPPAGQIDHFDLCASIHRALDNFQPLLSSITGMEALAGTDQDYMVWQSLRRDSAGQRQTGKGLVRTDMSYVGRVEDYSAVPDTLTQSNTDIVIGELALQ